MAGSTAKASSTTTKGVAVKRAPSSPTPKSSTSSKKARTSLVVSSGHTVITATSSSLEATALNMRPNTNVTNLAATANTSAETSVTRPKPNETAVLISAYGEISDSFSSLMERLKEASHARTSSLSTENRMFLASVERSLMDTMQGRLGPLARNLEWMR